MKTKIQFILVIFTFSFAASYSQEKKELNLQPVIKIYATPSYYFFDYKIVYSSTNYHCVYHYDYKLFNASSISIAFEQQVKDNLFKEIELMPLRFSRLYDDIYYSQTTGQTRINLQGSTSTFYEMHARYQINYIIGQGNTKFSIGASSLLFFNIFAQTPHLSRIYSMNLKNLGMGFDILPGMIIYLSDKIHLHINIPFRFYELYVKRSHTDNPNIYEQIRTHYSLNSELLPSKYYFRMGLSFDLGKE